MKRLTLVGIALGLAACEEPTTAEQTASVVDPVQTVVVQFARQYGLRVVGTGSEDGKRVLVLADVGGPGTTALEEALVAAGNLVVHRDGPDSNWDGTNPPPEYIQHFDAIVHLNGARQYAVPQVRAQEALTAFVRGGGTYIGSQWNGLEARDGFLPGMEELVLQHWSDSDKCNECVMVYTTIQGREKHPMLVGIPSPMEFWADGHASAPAVAFDENPAAALMRGPSGQPTVLVRHLDEGLVVQFSHAANARRRLTLRNRNIRQLYVNAVAWNGETEVISNHAPVANAGGPYRGQEGEAIVFDATGSSDEDGDELGFAWDFGDGTAASGPRPSHAYLDNGNYAVSLTVTDPEGASATVKSTVEVRNVDPSIQVGDGLANSRLLVASFSARAAIHSGQTYGLTAAFKDPGVLDAPWKYTIDWADGTSDSGSMKDQTEPIRGSHRFCTARDYSIMLGMTDKDDGYSSLEVGLAVHRVPVEIDIKGAASPKGDVDPAGAFHLNETDALSRTGHAGGVIPVAVLSTPDFDASTIQPASVTLGDGVGSETPVALLGNGTPMASFDDLDHNGSPDLMLRFERAALVATGDLDATTTHLVLQADLRDGCTQVEGLDVVSSIP